MNQQLHQTPIDKWSTREKLSLASSVQTAGDQNWYSVSRSLKPFGEPNRPADWFSQRNCALQYGQLLETVEAPKRKRGDKKEDTQQNLIVRKLTIERIDELKAVIETSQEQLADLKKNISLLKNDNLSETDMKIIESQMIEQLNQKRLEEQEHLKWLKERDEKYQSVARKKSIVNIKLPSRKDDQQQLAVTPSGTPTKSIPTGRPELDAGGQQPATPAAEDPGQAKAIKQENIVGQELASVEPPLPVRTTRERAAKEQEKAQLVVLGEEETEKVAEKSVVESTKADRQPVEKQLPAAKEKDQQATSKEKPMESVVKVASPAKMEVDVAGRDEDRSIEMSDTNAEEREEPAAVEQRGREESIASNKRKRTSTSGQVVQQPAAERPPAAQPTTPASQPTTPAATQTRRSGRISKPLRPSLTLSAPTTPKQLDSLEQQAKRTQIDESNIIVHHPVASASQLLLNDDSTKDSTTSDLTDAYTSPNSPASSTLNAENADPEQVREYKSWRRSIHQLLKQAQTHKFSSLFLTAVTDDEAKGYSTVVFRPIDLTIIRRKIEMGQIKSTAEFQRDIMLMFQNAIMYNSVKHEVHQMAVEMQKEILGLIEDFVNEQKTAKEQQQPVALSTPKSESIASTSIAASSRRKSRSTLS